MDASSFRKPVRVSQPPSALGRSNPFLACVAVSCTHVFSALSTVGPSGAGLVSFLASVPAQTPQPHMEVSQKEGEEQAGGWPGLSQEPPGSQRRAARQQSRAPRQTLTERIQGTDAPLDAATFSVRGQRRPALGRRAGWLHANGAPLRAWEDASV